MLHHLEHMIDRFNARSKPVSVLPAEHLAVAIRRAQDADMPLLHDLAELDSRKPLEGPVLVALVEGRMWAALRLDDGRIIADPFLPTTPAVELLRLRARQLQAHVGRPARRILPRRVVRRARA
jgi:hypothetical protein